MFGIKQLLGTNTCCYKRHFQDIYEFMSSLINIGLLYYFGLEIYNYSYSIGYNCTDSVLYMDYTILGKVIVSIFKLSSILLSICFWCALSPIILEKLECDCTALLETTFKKG